MAAALESVKQTDYYSSKVQKKYDTNLSKLAASAKRLKLAASPNSKLSTDEIKKALLAGATMLKTAESMTKEAKTISAKK